MAVNQVIVGDEVKLDLTGDTVSENNLLAGATAHNAAGEPIEGAVVVAPIDSELSETSENPVQNKVITKALNQIGGSISPTEKPVKMVSGFYTGDGTTNRIIDIGFKPTVVFLRSPHHSYTNPNYIILPNSPVCQYGDGTGDLYDIIVDNGFKLIIDYYNKKGSRYNYVAFAPVD